LLFLSCPIEKLDNLFIFLPAQAGIGNQVFYGTAVNPIFYRDSLEF